MTQSTDGVRSDRRFGVRLLDRPLAVVQRLKVIISPIAITNRKGREQQRTSALFRDVNRLIDLHCLHRIDETEQSADGRNRVGHNFSIMSSCLRCGRNRQDYRSGRSCWWEQPSRPYRSGLCSIAKSELTVHLE
jgi:hypothetical protein